jgi:hypothetical protein
MVNESRTSRNINREALGVMATAAGQELCPDRKIHRVVPLAAMYFAIISATSASLGCCMGSAFFDAMALLRKPT